MPTPKEYLVELRVTAERMPLGDAETRKLRGLFVDLVDALLGQRPSHPDVTQSGARTPFQDPGIAHAQHAVASRVELPASARPRALPGPHTEAAGEQVPIGTRRQGPHGPWTWNGSAWIPDEPGAVADPAGASAIAEMERALKAQEQQQKQPTK